MAPYMSRANVLEDIERYVRLSMQLYSMKTAENTLERCIGLLMLMTESYRV